MSEGYPSEDGIFSEDRIFARHPPIRGAVLIIGAGAVGGYLAAELAQAGIRPLVLVDYDNLEAENLVRHPLPWQYVDQPKASALKADLEQRFPWCNVEAETKNFLDLPAIRQRQLVAAADVVVVAADPGQCRLRVNQLCTDERVPAVYPSMWVDDALGAGEVSEVYWTLPGRHTPCYACWDPPREQGGGNNTSQARASDIKLLVLATFSVIHTLIDPAEGRVSTLDRQRNLMLIHGFVPPSRGGAGFFLSRGVHARYVHVPFPAVPCPVCDGHAGPAASFTASSRELVLTVDASTTVGDPASITPLEFVWDWGDDKQKTTTNSAVVQHNYDEPGEYQVELMVRDSTGVDRRAQPYRVNCRPVIADFVTKIDSLRVTVPKVELAAGADVSLTYAFGGGRSTINSSHTFPNPGRYSVTVSATNIAGFDFQTQPVLVNLPPKITNIVPDLDELLVRDVHVLGDLGIDYSLLYNWGNDGSPESSVAFHSYPRAGTYQLSVTVTNSAGSCTTGVPVSVSRPPTIKRINPSIEGRYVELHDVTVRAGSYPSFVYDWDDGSTSEWPAHGYLRPGKYTLTVTATDYGGSDRRPKTVEVRTPASSATFPQGLPLFQDYVIGRVGLRQLARSALKSRRAREVVWNLYELRALNAYAHADGCHDYPRLDLTWRRNYVVLVEDVDGLSRINPELAHDLAATPTDAATLLLAVESEAAQASLAQDAISACTFEANSQPWFRNLVPWLEDRLDQSDAGGVRPARLLLICKAAKLAREQYLEQKRLARERQNQLAAALALAIDRLASASEDVRIRDKAHPGGDTDIAALLRRSSSLIQTLSLAAQIARIDSVSITSEESAGLANRLPAVASELDQLSYQVRVTAAHLRERASRAQSEYELASEKPHLGPPPRPPSNAPLQNERWSLIVGIFLLAIGVTAFELGNAAGLFVTVVCGLVLGGCITSLVDGRKAVGQQYLDQEKYRKESALREVRAAKDRQLARHRLHLANAASAANRRTEALRPSIYAVGAHTDRIAKIATPPFIEQLLADLDRLTCEGMQRQGH